MSTKVKVFISYAREDHALADLVALQLREHPGIEVWRDVASIQPGARWPDKIDDALLSCDVFLIILTPDSTQSAYVIYEWMMATRLRPESESDATCIPLLFKACDPHPKLAEVQHLDFSRLAKPWDGLIAAITGSVGERAMMTSPARREPAVSIASRIGGPTEAPDHTDEQFDRAVTNILSYLGSKGFIRVSFQRLDKEFGYSEPFLKEMIKARSRLFQTASLTDRQSGEKLKGLKRL